RRVGNLEVGGGGADKQTEAAAGVDEVGRVAEELALLGVVVDCAVAGRRILDAKIASEVASGEVEVPFPCTAAQLDRRLDGVEAAAVQGNFVVDLFGSALARDIDDARGSKSILCRQRAGDERERFDEARVEFLAKPGDALRQQDIVDAVLKI